MSAVEQSPRILVGIDGSETSQHALRWATGLARNVGGSVSALLAWNYPTAMMMPVVGAPVLPADFKEEQAKRKLDAVVATGSDDVHVEKSTVMGSARAALVEQSERHDALVIGRTGNSRLKRLWLGSTAAYVVRHSDCPVVIVNFDREPESRITVAVDGSPASIDALVWALSLGPDNDVLAVYSHDEWELDDLSLDAPVRTELDAKAYELLDEAVQAAAAKSGVDADRIIQQVRQGDPRTTIVEQADPDELLVVGAQGHSGLARWMLGSLADYAVHHAPGSIAVWR